MSIVDTIKGCPLFHDLFDEEIDMLLSRGDIVALNDQDFIVNEGEEGNELFILLSGKLAVQKKGQILVEFKRGAMFGEMVLLNDKLRTADIVAKGPADVLRLDYDAIFGLYHKAPKILSVLLLNLSRILSERLKDSGKVINKLNSTISDLQKKSA